MTPHQIDLYASMVGSQIELLKRKRGVSSADLAKAINLTVDEYTCLESQGDFNLGQLKALSLKLNVTLSALVTMNEQTYSAFI